MSPAHRQSELSCCLLRTATSDHPENWNLMVPISQELSPFPPSSRGKGLSISQRTPDPS